MRTGAFTFFNMRCEHGGDRCAVEDLVRVQRFHPSCHVVRGAEDTTIRAQMPARCAVHGGVIEHGAPSRAVLAVTDRQFFLPPVGDTITGARYTGRHEQRIVEVSLVCHPAHRFHNDAQEAVANIGILVGGAGFEFQGSGQRELCEVGTVDGFLVVADRAGESRGMREQVMQGDP